MEREEVKDAMLFPYQVGREGNWFIVSDSCVRVCVCVCVCVTLV